MFSEQKKFGIGRVGENPGQSAELAEQPVLEGERIRTKEGGAPEAKETQEEASSEDIEASKAERHTAAMEEFENLEKDVRQIESKDAEFLEGSRDAFARFSHRAVNGNPRELGYARVVSMAEGATNVIKSRLKKIEESGSARSLVAGAKSELEPLFSSIGEAKDPKAALEKAENATKIFDKLLARLKESRSEKYKDRREISKTADENQGRSRSEFLRAEMTLKQDLKNSVLDNYQMESRRLSGAIKEGSGRLDAFDHAFLESVDKRKVKFRRLISG